MGQDQGKYHISKDGKVFRINEDGSFTELGNAEDLEKSKINIVTNNNKDPKSIKWKLFVCGIILIIAGLVIPPLLMQIFENDNKTDYVDDSYSHTDFVSGSLVLDNDSCVVAYRGFLMKTYTVTAYMNQTHQENAWM